MEYLQPADRPVVEGLEQHEIVMGRDQPEYNPLRCLAGNTTNGERLSRWTLTPEQREAVANGADIFVELLTFNLEMNPIRVGIGESLDADGWCSVYRLLESDYLAHWAK